jgi:hypothetical protein
MDISFLLLGAVTFVVAARYTTPVILRQLAHHGIYHARCIGHPIIHDASVDVSTDALYLVLSGDVSLALIARTDIRSVAVENTDDGLHRVSILWRNSYAETLTTLTFQYLRDARRVVRLLQ